jgi:hypothetical protein
MYHKPSERRQIYTGRYGVSRAMALAISRHPLQIEERIQFQVIRDGIFGRKLVTGTIPSEYLRLPLPVSFY